MYVWDKDVLPYMLNPFIISAVLFFFFHLFIEVKDKFGNRIPYHNSHPTTEKLISFSHKFTIYSEDDNTTTIVYTYIH